MKRYDVWDVDMRERCQESPDGNWVAYEDAEAEVERLLAEVSRLNASRTLLHEHIDTIDGYNSDLEEKYDEAMSALQLVSDAMKELRPVCTDGGDIADVLDSFIPAVKAVLEGKIIYLNPEESLRFAEMLLNPPEPNEALRKLMQDDE